MPKIMKTQIIGTFMVLFLSMESIRQGRGITLAQVIQDESFVKATEAEDGIVTVKITQGLIGETQNCNKDILTDKDQAKHFAMVYKDPLTLEETCLWERNVNACYQKTLVLPCDYQTKKASIDIYVVSDRSGTYLKEDTVANPRIGRCFEPLEDVIPRSIRHQSTFDCVDVNSFVEPESEVNLSYPPTCEHVKKQDRNAPDGDYTIWYHDRTGGSNHKPLKVYCKDMQKDDGTWPKEYISLAFPANNYASFVYNSTVTIRTNFDKVRLDPRTLKVNIADRSFTTSTPSRPVYWSVYQVEGVPYGTAYSCDNSYQQARIDLRKTGFKLSNNHDFQLEGRPAFFDYSGRQTFEKGRVIDGGMDDQFITILGGGLCGGQYPGSHKLQNVNEDPHSDTRAPLLDTDGQHYMLQLALVT